MTNEMKLLMTLCDALGFEVETIADKKERKETKEHAMAHNLLLGIGRGLTHTNGIYDIDEDGMYTSYLFEPEISYKLNLKTSLQTNSK